jgi:hypothetical protein
MPESLEPVYICMYTHVHTYVGTFTFKYSSKSKFRSKFDKVVSIHWSVYKHIFYIAAKISSGDFSLKTCHGCNVKSQFKNIFGSTIFRPDHFGTCWQNHFRTWLI